MLVQLIVDSSQDIESDSGKVGYFSGDIALKSKIRQNSLYYPTRKPQIHLGLLYSVMYPLGRVVIHNQLVRIVNKYKRPSMVCTQIVHLLVENTLPDVTTDKFHYFQDICQRWGYRFIQQHLTQFHADIVPKQLQSQPHVVFINCVAVKYTHRAR